jgi:hypothetical protein
MKPLLMVLAAVSFCLPVYSQTQATNVPDAPASLPNAQAAKPSFSLPPANYDRPTGPAPDPKAEWICDAPREGIFVDATADDEKTMKGELRSYMQLVHAELFHEWISRLPSDARNSWARGRTVKVRFVILQDGSISLPEVTVSSGRSDYDMAAKASIRDHGVFEPLPGDVKKVGVCLKFTTNTGLPPTPEGWYKSAHTQ